MSFICYVRGKNGTLRDNVREAHDKRALAEEALEEMTREKKRAEGRVKVLEER